MSDRPAPRSFRMNGRTVARALKHEKRMDQHAFMHDPSILAKVKGNENNYDLYKELFDDQWLFTEEKWALYSWNSYNRVDWVPGEGIRVVEIQGVFSGNKPTWDDLVTIQRSYIVDTLLSPSTLHWLPRYLDPAREKFTDNPVVRRGNIELAGGKGFDHLPAMSHSIHHAASAGKDISLAVVRDTAGKAVELWTEPHWQDLLVGLANSVNYAESAANRMRDRVIAQLEKVAHPNGGPSSTANTAKERLDARYAEALKIDALLQPDTLDAKMAEEIGRLKLASLPADLSLAKEVLVGRLEAAATGHQKNLKSALTQQAIDNWAACDDQDKALSEIARECSLGAIEISKAGDTIWTRAAGGWSKLDDDDPMPETIAHDGDAPPNAALGEDGDFYRQLTGIPQAKAAFDTAKARIEAVDALNNPEWKVNSITASGTVAVAGKAFTVRAHNPAGAQVQGAVVITSWGVEYPPGTTVPPTLRSRLLIPADDRTAHQFHVTAPTDAKFPMTFEFTAANLCGPSRLTVRLTG